MKYCVDRNVLYRVWLGETYSIEAETYNEAIDKLIAATKENGIDPIVNCDDIQQIDEIEYGEDMEPIEPKDNNGEYTLEIPDFKGKIVYTNA